MPRPGRSTSHGCAEHPDPLTQAAGRSSAERFVTPTAVRLATPARDERVPMRPSQPLVPLAGYAASTGSLDLPPPGSSLDTPPRRSGLRDFLPILAAIV